MNIKDLVGKRIADIRMKIKDFDYEGSIPLEQSDSYLILQTGEIIQLPYSGSEEIDIDLTGLDTHFSIFSIAKKKGTFLKFFASSENEKLIKRNIKYVQGQEIIGIYKFEDTHFSLDKYIIELKSGYLISEMTLSPKGTGHAGIWIFISMEDLKTKFDEKLIKVY